MEEGLRCDLTGGKIMTQGLLPLSFSLSQLISTYLESSQLAWTTVKNMNGSIVNVLKMIIKENQVFTSHTLSSLSAQLISTYPDSSRLARPTL